MAIEATIERMVSEVGSGFGILEAVSLFFVVLIVLEVVWDWVMGRVRDYKDTGANAIIGIGYDIVGKLAIGTAGVTVLFVVAALFQVVAIPVTWWSWVLAILVADLTYYWMHRIEHKSRFFWAIHSVHHSSEDFNLTTSLRLSWVEHLVEWIFLLPMILIGFNPLQTLLALAFVALYQTWIHTKKIGKLGWLEGILNTPSVHRVHHASNRGYWDKNFGGILMVWDRLFGTYETEKEAVVYGISEPVKTYNPIKIHTIGFARIWKDLKSCRTPSEMLRCVFGRPGFKPGGKGETV